MKKPGSNPSLSHTHTKSLYVTLASIRIKKQSVSRVFQSPLFNDFFFMQTTVTLSYKIPAFEHGYFQEATGENQNLTRSVAKVQRPTLWSLGIWVLELLRDVWQKSKLHNFFSFLIEQLAKWRWCIWKIVQNMTRGHFYF